MNKLVKKYNKTVTKKKVEEAIFFLLWPPIFFKLFLSFGNVTSLLLMNLHSYPILLDKVPEFLNNKFFPCTNI